MDKLMNYYQDIGIVYRYVRISSKSEFSLRINDNQEVILPSGFWKFDTKVLLDNRKVYTIQIGLKTNSFNSISVQTTDIQINDSSQTQVQEVENVALSFDSSDSIAYISQFINSFVSIVFNEEKIYGTLVGFFLDSGGRLKRICLSNAFGIISFDSQDIKEFHILDICKFLDNTVPVYHSSYAFPPGLYGLLCSAKVFIDNTFYDGVMSILVFCDGSVYDVSSGSSIFYPRAELFTSLSPSLNISLSSSITYLSRFYKKF